MKTTATIFLSVTLTVMLFTSCKYHCDGYDTSNKAALPFRIGDSIQYQSDKLDTIVLYVNDFYAEGSSSYISMPVMDYECSAEAYYTTTTDESTGISIKQVSGQNMNKNITIFCDNDIYDYYSKEKDFERTFLDSLKIGETMYEHVNAFKDLSGKKRISSFEKASYLGVVRFYDSQTKLTWTQINDPKID